MKAHVAFCVVVLVSVATGTARQSAPIEKVVKTGVCARETHALTVGGTVRAPRRIKDVMPRYPDIPKGTSARGGLWVGEFLIDATGKVTRVWTIRAIDFAPPLPAFNEAIVSAIRRWEYEPARVSGVAVPLCASMTMNIDWN